MRFSLDHLPRAHGGPAGTAVLRRTPEDFQVEEIIDFDAVESGEPDARFLWLKVRKTGANTAWVAERLAERAGCVLRDVGYAGLKDRHAVTTQWFSLPNRNKAIDWSGLRERGIEVLEWTCYPHKLRRGELDGNRFVIRLRDLDVDREVLVQRLQAVATAGAPNYFGEQRFGRDGNNLTEARNMFAGKPARDRHLRGLYLSAARAELFNRVLALRVEAGTWNQAMEGEAFVDSDNEPVYVGQVDEVVLERLSQGRIHPSGPMWGAGYPLVRDACRGLERRVMEENETLAKGLEQEQLRLQRRALRLVPRDLRWSWVEDGFEVRFQIVRGGFATAVLRELVGVPQYGST